MAQLNEHEYQSNPVSIPSGQPKESEDIVKKVNELLSRAKRYRKRFDCVWQQNYDFVFGGRQWDQLRPRWRFSEAINLTWSTIMMEVAIQTDARPKFEYTMQEFGDEAFTDVLKDINNRNWDKYKWSQVIQDLLTDGKVYHVAHAIVEWDPELEYGLGDVRLKTLNPYYAFWDPTAEDVNSGKMCRHFLYAEPLPTSIIKAKYPDRADEIKPDVNDFTGMREGVGSGSRIINTYDPSTPTRLPMSTDGQGEQYGGEPQTVLLRCWLRDDTLEELASECEDGTTEYITKKKYPMGRYIEIANNLLLRDGPPGVEVNGEWVPFDFECFPIIRHVNYQYPREYAGENEVTHIKGPQKVVNYVWSYILDCFRMAANPVKIVSTAADIDVDKLTNEPGLIVETNDVNGYRQEPGAPIAGGSFELLNTAKSLMDSVQGLQDVSRGAEQAGANSGVMLEGYLEAAQTRPRMKNRALDMTLQDLGQIMLRFMLQFYTKQRVFRITNKEGFPEYIEFYVSVDENGKKMATIRRRSTEDGKIYKETMAGTQVEIKGIPDVRVTSGSALPYAKAQRAQTSLQYFTSGAIDQEELLKEVDWPNYEQVVARMKEDQQAQAQMAAQAAGAPK